MAGVSAFVGLVSRDRADTPSLSVMHSSLTLPGHALGVIDQILSSIRMGGESALRARLGELRAGFTALTAPVDDGVISLSRSLLDALIGAEAPEPAWSHRVSLGARLLLAVMAEPSAFDELAGRLGGPEAAGVLRAVEEFLQAASEDVTPPAAPPVDARWGEVAERLSPRSDDAGLEARFIVDALAWFSGSLVVYPRLVSLGEGDDPPFPFLILGWQDPGDTLPMATLPGEPGVMPGECILAFDHQYGGYACLQARIIGIPLSLPEWRGDTVARLATAWWETAGDDMSAPDLAEWSAALGMELESGCEALLIGRPPAHLEGFFGRSWLRLSARRAGWHRCLEIWSADSVVVEEGGLFLEDQAALLRSLGERLGLGHPRPFVVWGNSD